MACAGYLTPEEIAGVVARRWPMRAEIGAAPDFRGSCRISPPSSRDDPAGAARLPQPDVPATLILQPDPVSGDESVAPGTDHERPRDRLYELLPVVYRLRDAEHGYPLRALLQVIAEQVNVVEDDIAQLYENWFIETCQDWVVPYIGDLIGYGPVHEAGEPARCDAPRARHATRS